jgi:hypothetical protein
VETAILTLAEAADVARVDVATVRRWCAGGLPHVPINGTLDRGRCEALILHDEMVGWLRSRCVRACVSKPTENPPRPAGRPPKTITRPGTGRLWPKPDV